MNASTPSVHAERQLHRDVGGWCECCHARLRPNHAMANPAPPPSAASSRLSIRHSPASRRGWPRSPVESPLRGGAPSARTSSRLATFAHAQQQDDGDDGRQHRENRAEDQLRAPGRFRERQYPPREPFIAARIPLDQPAADRLQFALRWRESTRHLPAAPSPRASAYPAPPAGHRPGRSCGCIVIRDPHVERDPKHRPLEVWGRMPTRKRLGG